MVVNYSVDPTNNCATLESFRSNRTQQPTAPVNIPTELDKVEISEKAQEPAAPVEPKKKRSFFQACKDTYASIKKSIITGWEYSKGIVKGTVIGGTAALGILGADAIVGAFKKSATRFSWQGKLAAGVVALGTMGYQLFQAHLNSNEKSADVDHRWGTGHNK